MRWHREEKRETEDPDVMSQHADSEACRKGVRLGLSTDGF
jgi:hypothetical protein